MDLDQTDQMKKQMTIVVTGILRVKHCFLDLDQTDQMKKQKTIVVIGILRVKHCF